MREIGYDGKKAALYARRWAFGRNPAYYDFERLGGDCTVEFLYNFLTANDGAGPYAEEAPLEKLRIGDVIQLGRGGGDFYHSLLAVGFIGGVPLVATHSFDAFARPLSSYSFAQLRALHIRGARAD